MILQTPIPPPPDIPFDPNLFASGDGPKIVLMIVLAALAAATLILWPIMRALGRRLEARGGADPSLTGELERVRQRVAELEPLQGRIAELEERLDFAERLLAQSKDPERLPS